MDIWQYNVIQSWQSHDVVIVVTDLRYFAKNAATIEPAGNKQQAHQAAVWHPILSIRTLLAWKIGRAKSNAITFFLTFSNNIL